MPVTPGPAGRYGHAACLLGSKFYIFGGQAEGAFMNDLWSYDIRQGELRLLCMMSWADQEGGGKGNGAGPSERRGTSEKQSECERPRS